MKWLFNFKRSYRIISRLITHKVGRNFLRNQQNIKEKSIQFVEEVIEEKGYHPHEIFNLDQSCSTSETASEHTHKKVISGFTQCWLNVRLHTQLHDISHRESGALHYT